jgi:peptidoglycan/LPS O-acetylase OafA/YrhL
MTAMRLAIPLLLMIAALQFRQQDLRPLELALLTNWLPAQGQILDYWFIEFMVQVFLIVAALFAIPAIRRIARSRPLAFAWAVLGTGAAAAALIPLVWDTTPMYDRVPHMLMWLFALGWMIRLASTPLLKAAVITLSLALPLLIWGPYGEVEFWVANGQLWVWGGCLFLLFVDRIPVPWPFNKLVFWVGGASMMIYIVHWQVYFNWQRLGLIDNDFVDIVVAITGGVVCWWIWEKLTRFIAQRFTRRQPFEAKPKARDASQVRLDRGPT